jgi:hypothetical protein
MDRLDKEGIPFGYETESFKIAVLPTPGHYCGQCGSKDIHKGVSRYTPDFFFPEWIIEAKGKFTARDRKRVLALLVTLVGSEDRRGFAMLFMRDNKLSKSSKTRYSDWCVKHGIPYAIGWFDREWLNHG